MPGPFKISGTDAHVTADSFIYTMYCNLGYHFLLKTCKSVDFPFPSKKIVK